MKFFVFAVVLTYLNVGIIHYKIGKGKYILWLDSNNDVLVCATNQRLIIGTGLL